MQKSYYILILITLYLFSIYAKNEYESLVTLNVTNTKRELLLLSNSNKFNYNDIKNLIVFGDSHSSVETNFTDMSYTGNNCSRGKNWPLHLIDIKNNTRLWDYAVGGSYIDEKLVKMWKWYHIDLKGQFKHFYDNMSENKKFYNEWSKKDSLFILWIGNNDIINLYNKNATAEIDEITNNLFDAIEKMYDVGANNILILKIFQKSFVLDNIKDSLKNNILRFNNNIITKSKDLFKKFPDINLIVYNTPDKFKNIISNCSTYKFKDCINNWNKNKDTRDYFWINSHISDSANRILAMDIDNLLNSINS